MGSGNRKRQSALYHQLARIAQDRKQYDQAEAGYCQALDIDLAYGDQSSAGITHHQLGLLAHDQQQYAQAQAGYRKALEIHRVSDPRAASSIAARLGAVLAELGQHREAVRILVPGAVSRHQETGQWAGEVLHGLQRERAVLGPGEFTGLVTAGLPADLAEDLMAAIEAADRPVATDERSG